MKLQIWRIWDDVLPETHVPEVAGTFFGGVWIDCARAQNRTIDTAIYVNVYRFEGKLRPSMSLIEISCNSVFAVIFFFWSTVTMMMSLNTMFPFLGLAGIISQLGNWGGISAYMLNKSTFTFGEYQVLVWR